MLVPNFISLKIESLEKHVIINVNEEKGHYSWDYRCFYSDPSHLSEIAEGMVDRSYYDQAKAKLMNFKIQPYLKNLQVLATLDGVTYTLILRGETSESSFRWQNKLPEEWADFTPVLDNLYRNIQLARSIAKTTGDR